MIWSLHEGRDPGTTVSLGIGIQRGVLLKDSKNVYALILGQRKRSRYQQNRRLGFQFGFIPHHGQIIEDMESSPIIFARTLVNQGFITHGSGDFYIHDGLNRVNIDCWADNFMFGGKDVRDWPEEKLLTANGLEVCGRIVDRLVNHAFL